MQRERRANRLFEFAPTIHIDLDLQLATRERAAWSSTRLLDLKRRSVISPV